MKVWVRARLFLRGEYSKYLFEYSNDVKPMMFCKAHLCSVLFYDLNKFKHKFELSGWLVMAYTRGLARTNPPIPVLNIMINVPA